MHSFDYLVIGGGIAGVTAAETIRARDEKCTIGIVSDEACPLYSRVMLSKQNFFLGKIPFSAIWMKQPEWYTSHRILLMGGRTAKKLDYKKKSVELSDGSKVTYGKLLLATGTVVRHWNVPGAPGKKNIYNLRTIEDGKAIMAAIKDAKRGIVVGGGFISFEMADLLALAGLETTLLLRGSYYWEPLLDEVSGRMIEEGLAKAGIKLLRNTEVREVRGKGNRATSVILKDNQELETDMIVCGIGTECNLRWLKDAGIALNQGILANEYLETNVPDIWTAGDVAEYKDLILDEVIQMGSWVNAAEQGRIAAVNMMGARKPFLFVSFYTTQGAGMSVAFVGDVRLMPSREMVRRGSPATGSYGRIIILDKGNRKEVEGATLLNRTGEMRPIAKLIEMNTDILPFMKELEDEHSDLNALVKQLSANTKS